MEIGRNVDMEVLKLSIDSSRVAPSGDQCIILQSMDRGAPLRLNVRRWSECKRTQSNCHQVTNVFSGDILFVTNLRTRGTLTNVN